MRRLISLALCTVAATPSFALTVSIWVEAPTVCIYATGSLQAQPSGGTAPYTFAWSNGSTEQGIIGLVAGTYSVTVTDAVSATATAEWTFTEDPLQAYVGAFQGCPGGQLGPEFRMLGQGGTYAVGVPPITFSDPSYYGDVITGQQPYEQAFYLATFSSWPAPGSAALMLPFTDSNGCPGTMEVQIPAEPFAYPVPQVLTVDAACSDGNNGGVLVHVPASPNLWPNYIDLIWNDQPQLYGQLEELYNYGQLFGEQARTVERHDLLAGDYALVTWTRFPSQYDWLHEQFFFGGSQCGDTTWFTVPDLGYTCGTVNGTAYMDDNEDCAMAYNETRVPQAVMQIEPGGYFEMTNASGYYHANIPYGSYTIEQAPSNVVEHCAGAPIPFDLSSGATLVTRNFPDTALLPRDVWIDLASSAARPGFQTSVHVGVQHATPGATGNLTISLTFDPLLSFVSATPTGNVVGNTITWTTAQLTSFAQRSVGAVFQVPADVGLIGTELLYTASVSIVQPEVDLTNNSTTYTRTITGSYDPNAKEVVTSSDFSDELYLIDEDEWVDYTIQFQNTGNDTAFFVVITDTLPSTLDPLTFRLGARSHPCIVDMMGQGVLRFAFPNILLPDSNVNEPRSHGFVKFRIQPRLPILPGTTIENIANIFFDYNPAIITGPSVLVAEFSTSVLPNSYVTGLELFPNPTNGSFTVRSPHSSIRSVQLLSADGRLVMQEQSAGGPSIMIDATSLAPGTYIVVTTSGTGARSRTRLTKN
ncbi:MAG: T9SS type A sorting domain-containing protein [Flavobacteriales bacterium]|mgnify:CR=1 FL=1|nr:T9SS type A sorting domain-containing protein [Flavobacteriales bacterium]